MVVSRKTTLIILSFCSLLALSTRGYASRVRKTRTALTDSAMVSLITCSSGDELYSTFGHSAIRVKDIHNKLDVVFNYGTFDFWDPDFYPKFVKGRLKYLLSVCPYKDFEKDLVAEKRWIYEQKLNLNLQEKQYLFDSLLINYRPQNRFYSYDFFLDNCATRIRNIFVEAIPRKIMFNYSSFEKGTSYRQLLMPSLTQKPWSKLGINLLLGLSADKVASPWDYMYLPTYLHDAFEHALFSSDSIKTPFAQKTQVLLAGEQPTKGITLWAPQWVFLFILVVALFITYTNYKKGFVKSLWFDRLLLIVAGLLGALFTFLWVGTAHRAMACNLNLLWANPLHLIVVFFISTKKCRQWVKVYFKVNLLILIAVLITWPVFPQALPWAIFPLVLALALRVYMITRLAPKNDCC